MLKNLAKLDQTEMDKVNVDLAAAGVAFNCLLYTSPSPRDA